MLALRPSSAKKPFWMATTPLEEERAVDDADVDGFAWALLRLDGCDDQQDSIVAAMRR